MQHEVDTEHRWSAAKWIGLTLVGLMALLVLYVLSTGPVLLLWKHDILEGDIFQPWILWFYYPLFYSEWLSETVAPFMEWYLSLWGL